VRGLSFSRFLELQVEEVVKKRKKARAIASAAIGLAVYIIIVVLAILLSPFISFYERVLTLVLGAMAGALTSVAYYMLETYPTFPESFMVYGEVVGDTSQLIGVDVPITAEMMRNGAIEISDFAKRHRVDKSVVVSRIIELEKAGILKVNRIEAT